MQRVYLEPVVGNILYFRFGKNVWPNCSQSFVKFGWVNLK